MTDAIEVLKFTSCMAANADSTCAALVEYISRRLSIPVLFINDVDWQDRERLFDAGEIQVCWICGLPYIRKADQPHSTIELLAAPVMQGDRYQNRPVYFSDVVVRQDSPFHNFTDLRGAVWAYNEPRSHSGFYVACADLAERGETLNYFGQVIQSGAHQTSLQWLLAGKVDVTTIDSTVLETEMRRDPQLQSKIRVIATLGPSPMPPWLISTAVPPSLRQQLRSLLLNLHEDPQGQQILSAARMARFAAVSDRDYQPIREMAQRAATVIPPQPPNSIHAD